MNKVIRNTKFDNLVNYQTVLSSNSSHQTIGFQTSADPNALSALIKDNQIVVYSVLNNNETNNLENR